MLSLAINCRSMLEIPIQLMVVQHFSAEIDFHMLKNMRFESPLDVGVCFCVFFLCFFFMHQRVTCLQVEFNKAAQSLTDALVPSAQRKTALNRLVKVSVLQLILLKFCRCARNFFHFMLA
jgi:hypothetical protein